MQQKLNMKTKDNIYPDYEFQEGETIKCFVKKFSRVKPQQRLLSIKRGDDVEKAWTPLHLMERTNLSYLLYGVLGKYVSIKCIQLLKKNVNGDIIQEDKWEIRLLTKEEYERD